MNEAAYSNVELMNDLEKATTDRQKKSSKVKRYFHQQLAAQLTAQLTEESVMMTGSRQHSVQVIAAGVAHILNPIRHITATLAIHQI